MYGAGSMDIPGRVAETVSRVHQSAYRTRFRVEQRKGGATQSRPSQPPARDQRRYYGHRAEPVLSPHTSCFFDSDKSSVTPYLADLIGYPNPRTGTPHDCADSECRGCAPLLQLNTQSVRLPRFPDSI
ncbi:hypothetical protein N7491_008831 [Penicillium cf. griseofulvum]|uniref:Uncharacterized protein n=1 Tax=Penicillium cf. griseofulvum TaxID=2972120 RepID=A0A9W9JRP5_9EURO|nr:hypothetical protein N7472_005571 [Penicillium cf. griseofulvum]KAJ5423615.1 hypothetical protein N7491_008831 [Penicillium cf. griseofulvum]